MRACMMACDTELREVDKKRYDAEVSDCDLCIVARFFLRLVLQHLFSTLVSVPYSTAIRGNANVLLMGFIVLLLTISSNNGVLSNSD